MLREIGYNTTNVEAPWAGAENNLARGLNAWTRMQIGRDREIAVRAAVVVCALVADKYTADRDGLPPRSYIDDMLARVRAWLDEPGRESADRVRSFLDVTRNAHAWQQEEHEDASFWILDAVDHASLAVWSGERASYIVPLDYATCAGRSVACVFHAMLHAGTSEDAAVSAIVDAVAIAAG